jgi:hypothetical protein
MTQEKPSLPSAVKLAAAILYEDELSPVEAIKADRLRVARLVLDSINGELDEWMKANNDLGNKEGVRAIALAINSINSLDVEKLLEGK